MIRGKVILPLWFFVEFTGTGVTNRITLNGRNLTIDTKADYARKRKSWDSSIGYASVSSSSNYTSNDGLESTNGNTLSNLFLCNLSSLALKQCM